MPLLSNIIFFVVASFVLFLSGAFLVRALVIISHFLKISEFLIGFIIMSIASTLPELFVGINSALAKEPILSLGNIIGTIIVNLGLVCGISTLLARRIPIRFKIMRISSVSTSLFLIVLALIIILAKGISRLGALILISLYLLYLGFLFGKIKKVVVKEEFPRWKVVLAPLVAILSIFALHLSAQYVVKYGIAISTDLNLNSIFIGLFFIALGTSLPELVFAIHAIISRHAGLVIGNLLGANLIDLTLVLGTTALIEPIRIGIFQILLPLTTAFVISVVFITFAESGRNLTWLEGISLIFLYILFLMIQLSIGGLLG